MNFNKQISKIINKMTEDNMVNTKIIAKNKLIIKNFLRDDDFLHKLVALDCDEKKLITFYIHLIKTDDYAFRTIELFNIPNKNDLLGGNFLQTAMQNGKSINFIYEISGFTWCFLGSSRIRVLFNFVDKNGDSFIHSYLKKLLTSKEKIDDKFIQHYKNIVIDGFKYDKLINSDGLTVFDILKTLDRTQITLQQLLSIENINYETNFYNFLKELTGNKEEDLKLINETYGSVNYVDNNGTLLTRTIKVLNNHSIVNNYNKKEMTEFIVSKIEQLLSYGVNPNIEDFNMYTYLHYAVLFIDDFITIDKLIDNGVEYGFDVNTRPSITSIKLKSGVSYLTFYKYYSLLKKYGYNNFEADFTIDDVKNKTDVSDYDIRYFRDKHNFNRRIDFIRVNLKNNNLKVEERFEEKFNEIYCDFISIFEIIKNFYYTNDDKEILTEMINMILEKRNNNLCNNSNVVSVEEILEALKSLVLKRQSYIFEKIDRCKQNILIDKIDGCKQNVLVGKKR